MPSLSSGVSGDSHDLALALSPVLAGACERRLGPIEWFRSRWQRGGAATGLSTWRRPDGRTIDVFIKLPVGPSEFRWTTELGTVRDEDWDAAWCAELSTPRVVARGTDLGGYDLAWIVTERLSGAPLAAQLDAAGICDMLSAAADFQARAMKVAPLGPRPPNPDWERLLARSKEIAKEGEIPEAHRWKDAVKRVQKVLPILQARWHSRPINSWCHGDLHAGNAMRRAGGPNTPGTCVLVDLALVHPGHWLEDALYLERQHWGHAEMLHGVKPLTELARLRRERRLPVDDHYPELANVRRVLMAACAPAVMEREGNLKYLHAALDVIERMLPQAVK